MKVSLGNIGQFGVNKDLAQGELPPNVWTDANNIRFAAGSAGVASGYASMYNGVSPTVSPYHVAPVTISSGYYWFYAGAAKVYLLGDSTNVNVTRQTTGVDVDYTAATNEWTSCFVSGVPILNPGNVIDPPQMFTPLATSTKLQALTNWPASTYCAVLRSYKNYLIALNVTKSSVSYPYLVKWSHPADIGAVPASWDETDATKDAGEYPLADGQDTILDGLSLGDSFIIYKEKSVWKMNYTGGAFVFSFAKIHGLSGIGILARNCAVDIGGRHFVFTGDDVIVHDGNAYKSVVDAVTKQHLFRDIDASNYSKCFVFRNPNTNEAYACYPSGGSTVPDRALVYNYRDNTISFRDIPSVNHAQDGPVDLPTDEAWSVDSGTWGATTDTWANPGAVPTVSSAVMASANGIYVLGQTNQADGSFISANMERQGLSFDAPESIKLVKRIYPRITGTDGETVSVKVGYGETPYATPTYDSTLTYTIGTTTYLDTLVSGRYIALWFGSTATNYWRLDSCDVDVEAASDW